MMGFRMDDFCFQMVMIRCNFFHIRAIWIKHRINSIGRVAFFRRFYGFLSTFHFHDCYFGETATCRNGIYRSPLPAFFRDVMTLRECTITSHNAAFL